MRTPRRDPNIETELARAAIAAETRAADLLAQLPQTAEAAERARRAGDRAARRAALRQLIESIDDHPSDQAARAREAWAESTALAWELAERGLDAARFECRRLRAAGALTRADLLQEARIGLFEAACRFDPERDNSFATYARWRVRARLVKAQQHTRRGMRMPDSALRDLRRLREAQQALSANGESPELARVADAAGLSPKRARAVAALDSVESLDAPVEHGDLCRRDLLRSSLDPRRTVVRTRRRSRVRKALKRALDDRERRVVAMRFGLDGREPAPFRVIGRRLGVSGERARQLGKRALKRLEAVLR